MPKVSVLMPVYNVQKYISEAIDSILNQTFNDFELIILDDCSEDETPSIIKAYNDPRIIFHQNKHNLGLAENLNIGLKLAKGYYIARMDGDDISLSARLQTQVDFLEKHTDIDLCSCGMRMFGADNKTWIRDRDTEQVRITMMFYSAILHASSVFRKESFEKNGLIYNQNAFPAEDYDLWSRAVFYCKLVNIPDVLYLYRIHNTQVTNNIKRSEAKCREIQLKYIHRALPTLSETDVIKFVDGFIYNQQQNISEIYNSKKESIKIINSNNESLFFHPQKLKRTLKKHYQSKILNFIKSNEINGLLDLYHVFIALFHLSYKQIFKLILPNVF